MPEPSHLAHIRVVPAAALFLARRMRLRDHALELLRALLKSCGVIPLIIGRRVRVGGGMGRNNVVQLNGAGRSSHVVVLS